MGKGSVDSLWHKCPQPVPGPPTDLGEDHRCEFSHRRDQASGFDEEAIAQLLCIPGQDFAWTVANSQLDDTAAQQHSPQ